MIKDILHYKHITSFLISNAHFTGQKNKKKCKINSRNFVYDGPTFSIESAIVKDALLQSAFEM
uniref:Uncharacterized protein n=1 Tax=viral metagenome TaxID=1070528 RepID=A0A6C0HXV3_9ZZZZ